MKRVGVPGNPQGSKWFQAKLQPPWGLGEVAPALALPDLPSSFFQSQVLSSQVGCTLWFRSVGLRLFFTKRHLGVPLGAPDARWVSRCGT